jgi:hypothetical protein
MPLFGGQPLDHFLDAKIALMHKEVDAMSDERLAGTPAEDLCTYLIEKYSVCVPMLPDVLPPADVVDGGRNKTYSTVTFHIPLQGDGDLLNTSPRMYPTLDDKFHIRENTLTLPYSVPKADVNGLLDRRSKDIARIKECLVGVSQRVQHYTDELRQSARKLVDGQKELLSRNQAFGNRLAQVIPIRRRSDGREQIIVPLARKKIPTLPPIGQSSAEPVISMAAYDDILKVITSMVNVVERSPAVFRNMEEEDLRTILLVGLNGIYEGKATGETFNGVGDNDILIREGDRTVFIAECLMWKGTEYLRSKLDDQLFKYATWRDSKLAVLIFNRKKDFTAIIEKTKEACDRHPQKVTALPYQHESGFRYTFRRLDDAEKHFTLTVIAFEVPANSEGEPQPPRRIRSNKK